MKTEYKHTQRGWLILSILWGGALFSIIIFIIKGHRVNLIDYIVITILVASAILFSSLTVVIKEDILQIRFGPGLIRKAFLLKEIVSCRVVKNPWYYGLGIHKMPGGWIYNISGLMAVELLMKDGRRYRIGTDEPEELHRAIQSNLDDK
jgi:hypothetical protein